MKFYSFIITQVLVPKQFWKAKWRTKQRVQPERKYDANQKIAYSTSYSEISRKKATELYCILVHFFV